MNQRLVFLHFAATLVLSLLLMLSMSACVAQISTELPATPPEEEQIIPTEIEPTATVEIQPTPIPTVLAPDTPGLVTSLEEILGFWKSRGGGGGTLYHEIRSDGTYRTAYDPPSETGITSVDSGKISITETIIHLYSGTFCETGQDGFYQATRINIDDHWYLTFYPIQDDCSDRKNAWSREMPARE